MDLSPYINKLVNYFIDSKPRQITTSKIRCFDRTYVKADLFSDRDLLKSCGIEIVSAFDKSKKKEIADTVFTTLKTRIEELKNQNRVALKKKRLKSLPSEIEENSRLITDSCGEIDILDLQPLVDLGTSQKLMLSMKHNRIASCNYEVWVEMVRDAKIPWEDLPQLKAAKFIYNPKIKYSFHVMNVSGIDESIIGVNTYVPPSWKFKKDQEMSSPSYPPIIDKLLSHMCKTNMGKRYILAWIRESILSKNLTCLVLNGGKGLGKTILSEIIKQLHGESNCSIAPQSLLSPNSLFNSLLKNKTFIYIDENKIGKSQHTILKEITNNNLSIEAKGKDPEDIVSYCNFFITHNELTDMYLEPDDRRFSVIDISENERLDLKWAKEELEEILLLSEGFNPSAIESFARWLLEEDFSEEFPNMSDPVRESKFYDLVIESLCRWKKFLIEIFSSLVENPEDLEDDEHIFLIEDIKKEYAKQSDVGRGKFSVNRLSLINAFLREFDFYGHGSIGCALTVDGEPCVKYNRELIDLLRDVEVGLEDI